MRFTSWEPPAETASAIAWMLRRSSQLAAGWEPHAEQPRARECMREATCPVKDPIDNADDAKRWSRLPVWRVRRKRIRLCRVAPACVRRCRPSRTVGFASYSVPSQMNVLAVPQRLPQLHPTFLRTTHAYSHVRHRHLLRVSCSSSIDSRSLPSEMHHPPPRKGFKPRVVLLLIYLHTICPPQPATLPPTTH
jgi:hypothetical protein